MGEDSPHGVEVVIRRYIILIVTCQTQLIPITLMDKMPQLFGTQWLDKMRAIETQWANMAIKHFFSKDHWE